MPGVYWEALDHGEALGLVIEEGRGSLPFALIHGEALVASAAWAMGEAGVHLIDFAQPWEDLAHITEEDGSRLVLHDPLCPMTPPDFIADCARRSAAHESAVVAVHPVTDTIKQVKDGRLVGTLDRDQLRIVCSPIVVPPAVVARWAADGALPSVDFPALVEWLEASETQVEYVEAPPQARRVAVADDLELLAALSDPNR